MDLERRVQERTAELAAANARLTSALRGSGIVVFEQDADLRYSWVMESAGGDALIGRTDADLHPPATAQALEQVKRAAMNSRSPQVAEIELDLAGKPGTWAVWVDPRVDQGGAATGVTCVAVDVTERRENEERMRDVMRELSHRSKNLLAIVAAIANQTARTSSGVAEFRARFMERLQSLASTHDTLVASDWFGADLTELVELQLQPYQSSYADGFDVDGPPVMLAPHASQYVALALHELAANATKHGALAHGGVVKLRWQRRPEGTVELEWREYGDNPPRPFERRGFGWTLLEQLVPRAIGGECVLELGEAGLSYRLTIGRAQLLDGPH
jgi:two-component sensor histidine kinase